MTKLTKQKAAELVKVHGIVLGRDFHTLGSDAKGNVISAADAVKYRGPENASGSRGRSFYDLLNRLLDEGKTIGTEGNEVSVSKVIAADEAPVTRIIAHVQTVFDRRPRSGGGAVVGFDIDPIMPDALQVCGRIDHGDFLKFDCDGLRKLFLFAREQLATQYGITSDDL